MDNRVFTKAVQKGATKAILVALATREGEQ